MRVANMRATSLPQSLGRANSSKGRQMALTGCSFGPGQARPSQAPLEGDPGSPWPLVPHCIFHADSLGAWVSAVPVLLALALISLPLLKQGLPISVGPLMSIR